MGEVTVAEADASRFADAAAEAARTTHDALQCAEELVKKAGALKQREGISLLEVKSRDLLVYTREMALLMAAMALGESIQGADEVARLVKHRTVLEKVRAMEKKMAVQIDKLTAAASGAGKGKEVLRARPDMMELDGDEESEEEDEDEEGTGKKSKKKMGTGEEGGSKVKKYVPPKVMAVHYDEHEEARDDKRKAVLRKRALQSSLVQELKAQYSEAPEEISEGRRVRRQADKERIAYEEEYLMRTQLNKKEKAARRREERENALDSLLKFGDYMAGDEDQIRVREQRAAGKGGKAGDKSKRKRPFKGGPKAKKAKKGGGGGGGKGKRRH